jgi:glutaredoxin-related protein
MAESFERQTKKIVKMSWICDWCVCSSEELDKITIDHSSINIVDDMFVLCFIVHRKGNRLLRFNIRVSNTYDLGVSNFGVWSR